MRDFKPPGLRDHRSRVGDAIDLMRRTLGPAYQGLVYRAARRVEPV